MAPYRQMLLQRLHGARAKVLSRAWLIVMVGAGCGPGVGKWWELDKDESTGSSTETSEGTPTSSDSAVGATSSEYPDGTTTLDESTSGESSSSGGTSTSVETTGSGSSSTEVPISCEQQDNATGCAMAGCQGVVGRRFNSDEASVCLEATAFLGCIPMMNCGDIILTVCNGNQKYQLPSGCAPEGWVECTPPPDAGMNGYPDCP